MTDSLRARRTACGERQAIPIVTKPDSGRQLAAGPSSLAQALAGRPGVRLEPGADLARRTTLRAGGRAELLVEVDTERALAAVLARLREAGASFFLLGLGSNVLVPDGVFPGVVLRLAGHFRRVRAWGERVSAGGAMPLPRLALRTAAMGLRGLEPLSGFPSTVGGAVFMNAGCYGTEIKDLLVRATLIGRDGARRRVGPLELEPGYRRTVLQASGEIVTRATFELRRGSAEEALARIEELNLRRRASLPYTHPNAGSIFKNPTGDYAGRLIEACGLKGTQRGGARISERHANVIVNAGGARSEEVLGLMLLAREAVAARFGVLLEPEIVLAGELAERWRRAAAALPA